MRTIVHFLIPTTLLLGGCATHQARLCQNTGPIHLHQTVYVNGPSVRVDRLIEDSRCPVDVNCVRAGDVRIAVTVIGGSQNWPLELTLGKPMQVADGTLTLLSVTPAKRSATAIQPQDYRFTFDFSGGL